MQDQSGASQENKGLPIEFRAKPVDRELRESNWSAIEAAILQPAEQGRVRRIGFGWVMAVAAAVLVLVVGVWHLTKRPGNPMLSLERTAYGEVKSIMLPDSSIVILNANSSIRLSQQWADDGNREVWLEGEAYFQVTKKRSTKAKFVVHTKQVDVEVLGTRFNVNARHERSIVSLEEGKVQLLMHAKARPSDGTQTEMVLRPGQVVVVNDVHEAKLNDERDVAAHSGWSRNEFHFDNTSLSEIARMIQDTYGYKMEVKDTTLYNRLVSGDLRAENVEELVKVLEVALKLSMRIEDRTIHVTQP